MNKDDGKTLYDKISEHAKENINYSDNQAKKGPSKDFWFIYNVVLTCLGIIVLLSLAVSLSIKQYHFIGIIGVGVFFVLGMFYSEIKIKHKAHENTDNINRVSMNYFKNFSNQLNHRK